MSEILNEAKWGSGSGFPLACKLHVSTYHGEPGTGVLETGLDRSAAFCSSVISGSFGF